MVDLSTLVTHERSGMAVRPDTLDTYVIGERGQYLALNPGPGDRLLDIGGNIGAVTRLFLERGVDIVHTYEPDPDNFHLLTINCASWLNRRDDQGLVQCRAAVVGRAAEDETDRSFYLNGGKNKGTHTTVPTRGREEITVPIVTMGEAVGTLCPTLLKIDIEGGEYDLLPWFKTGIPDYVRGIAMEIHLTRAEWRHELATELIGTITGQGFQVVKAPRVGEKNWTTFAVWLR